MASTLTTTGLKVTDAYGESGWAATYNYNWQRINDTIGKLSGLIDVQISGIANTHVLRWNAGSSKFVNVLPTRNIAFITTTTTTSSTTTTTTAP